MRLSLWQQFSSNHSADFVVVGRFKSSDEAEKAANEVRNILTTIQAWYEKPENRDTVEAIHEVMNHEGGSIPMPIEVKLGSQYEIKWDEQFPDTLWYTESHDATDAVFQYGQDVVLESGHAGGRTWSGSEVARRLLKRFGAETVFREDNMVFEKYLVRITWDAPDEATAEHLMQDYQRVQAIIDRDPEHFDFRQSVPFAYWGGEESCGLTHNGQAFTYLLCEIGELSSMLPELIEYLKRHQCTNIQYDYEWAEGFAPDEEEED
jgi:hypothetical protein